MLIKIAFNYGSITNNKKLLNAKSAKGFMILSIAKNIQHALNNDAIIIGKTGVSLCGSYHLFYSLFMLFFQYIYDSFKTNR